MAEDYTWIIGGGALVLLVMMLKNNSGGGQVQIIPNITQSDVAVIQSNNALVASLAQTQAQLRYGLAGLGVNYALGTQQISAEQQVANRQINASENVALAQNAAQETVAMTNLADNMAQFNQKAALEGQLLNNQLQISYWQYKLEKMKSTFQEWIAQAELQTKQNISGSAENAAHNSQYIQILSGLAGAAAAFFL